MASGSQPVVGNRAVSPETGEHLSGASYPASCPSVPPISAPSAQELAQAGAPITEADIQAFLVDAIDADGDWTRHLEGRPLNLLSDPPEHRHTCTECREEWLHRDEECCHDAISDPFYRGAYTAGYAACPSCAAPGSNGTLRRWCRACQTFILADPSGLPGCGCVA